MNVSSINQVAFTSKVATTKKGNEYKKTNLGTKIGSGLGVGLMSLQLFRVRAVVKNAFKKAPGVKAKAGFVVGMSIATAINVLLFGAPGLIIDSIVNKVRRNKADKVADKI